MSRSMLGFGIGLVLLLAGGSRAQELDARTIVSHPLRWEGRFAEAAQDLVARLEERPASPLAATAWAEVSDLLHLADSALDPARLARILERTRGPLARLRAGELLVGAARRTRFSEHPFTLEGDIWKYAVRHWRVLGPFGPLDHPAPLRLPPGPGSPELGLTATHPSSFGVPLAWRPLERAANQLYVLPGRGMAHSGDGLVYLSAHLALAVPEALLEIDCPGEFQVWWNGELVFDLPARGPGRGESRFLVPVAGSGWNELLIRTENRMGVRVAARIVAAGGQGMAAFEEWQGEGIPPRPDYVAPHISVPADPMPAEGWGRALWALERVDRGRADQALAAVPREELSGELQRAWLRVRFEALARSSHLPDELLRRSLVAVEEEMEAAGGLLPEVWAQRVLRLTSEDKPEEALAELDALEAALPPCVTFALLRPMALAALDRTGVLALDELRRLRGLFPSSGRCASLLAERLERRGDPIGALPHWRAALAASGDDSEIQEQALGAMARAGGESLREARAWLEGWIEAAPDLRRPRELYQALLEASGADGELEELLRDRLERASADDPRPRRALSEFLISRGRFEEARGILESLLAADPGDHEVRAILSRLGQPSPAERFFQAFAPDREEALAAATGASDASIAEALDSGLVYLYPDGSSHERYHTITLALDRKGTELLHERDVAEHPLLAQVLKADGRVIEPSSVDGKWVMPSLEPGDAVELVWDQFTRGHAGSPPDIGWWRFASFEKPFVRSRYVIFVPDGLPAELRSFHFDGEHEELRFEGGTVQVFLVKDRPRQEEEPLRPSYEEILPWVQLGGDRPLAYAAAALRDRLEGFTHLPADLEGELRELVLSTRPQAPAAERARALFDAVTARVLDFGGSAVAAQVWPSRRGNPIFLLASLFRLAGIEFEWGALEKGIAPELDREPVRAFQDLRGFQLPVLRLAGEPPLWIPAPAGRGDAFGSIPPDLAGARVMVLQEDGGTRFEELPRDVLEDTWDQDTLVRYELAEDGSARVKASLRITTSQGSLLREQVLQAGDQQRAGAARSIAGQVVPGVDLERFDFPALATHGGPFEFTFEGRVPALARRSGETWRAALPLRPTGLATGLGPAERHWPLALRFSQRQRARVEIRGEGWRLRSAPESFREERAGLEHSLEVESGECLLSVERRFIVRGAFFTPDEVPAFLADEARFEREIGRQVELERTQ